MISWPPGPLKSMVISILLNIGMMKFLTLHPILITKIVIFQIKILNEINFFLIVSYVLLQFETVLFIPLKFLWTANYQNALQLTTVHLG